MGRKLFCEISPLTYKISVYKCRIVRTIKDLFSEEKFAKEKSEELLPVSIYKNSSLIRRRLGDVNMEYQENKAANLALAVPKVNKVLIKPGETFSFWHLVGNTTEALGYKVGLTIDKGNPSSGIGGGMCQFTNLIHWLVLHSSLKICEHHHHDGVDLFPDYNRQVPFGSGTSIVYNYLDYRVKNNTDNVYQIVVYTDGEYLFGELRAKKHEKFKYNIKSENEYFSLENDGVYRNGEIYRNTIDPLSGRTVKTELIKKNHAKVMYDTDGIVVINKIKNE